MISYTRIQIGFIFKLIGVTYNTLLTTLNRIKDIYKDFESQILYK